MKKSLLAILLTILLGCNKEILAPEILSNNPLISQQDIQVDNIFNQYRAGLNTVGISIGILKNGIYSYYGYGETQKGSGIVPNAHTNFEIGSVTKVYTAIAIVRMLESDGKSIDSPIKSYLPPDLPTLNRNGIELTFKHLLTHTSGLPYMPNNLPLSFYTNTAKGWRDYDVNKLYSSLIRTRLAFDPFTEFLYSNTAFGIMGVILERRYGRDYGQVINDLILAPLALYMTTAYFSETDQTNWAKGYSTNGKETDYWETLNALDGAGVLKSNATDMLTFAKNNIDVSNSSLANSIALCQNIFTNIERQTNYDVTVNCLGWFSYKNNSITNQTFLYHNGGTGGFNSEFFINKEKESALIILFNTDGNTESRQFFIRDLLKLIIQ